MWLASHPAANPLAQNLRRQLAAQGLLKEFWTTLAWPPDSLWHRYAPRSLRRELDRRTIHEPEAPARMTGGREWGRLLASRFGGKFLVRHEKGIFSVDRVSQSFDRRVARQVARLAAELTGVIAVEDAAASTFATAQAAGLARWYVLPIAHYRLSNQILNEQRERYPDWARTIPGVNNSEEKLLRKDEELALANGIICPSQFVADSLPPELMGERPQVIIPFGTPFSDRLNQPPTEADPRANRSTPFRVLFAGTLTQRKGLADLFAAVALITGANLEIHLCGSPLADLEFYRKRCPGLIYHPPCPWPEMLALMGSCHLLALPSLIEGRALVLQEAMSQGCPILITPNTGGEDLVIPGETGFCVPVNSPEALAEKIDWFLHHRKRWAGMSDASRQKAATYTWKDFGGKLASTLRRGEPAL